MITITKERLLTIKQWRETYGPGSNVVLPAEEAEELARIALASLEAEPVVYMWDSERKDIDAPGYYRAEHLVFAESSVKQWGGRVVPLYTAPPATVVPEFETWFNSQESGRSICSTQIRRSLQEISWNACCAAMLQSGNFRESKNSSTNNFRKIPEASTSSPVTPALLPGGFTIEEAKELHEDLVRSHISKALSGEKMKKKDRDADLRWIHGVIVQAAWFVKASLEQNALSGNSPGTPDGWISCSDRMPEDTKMLLAFSQGEIVAAYWNWVVNPIDYKKYRAFTYLSGNILDDVTHWMPLPEPPL